MAFDTNQPAYQALRAIVSERTNRIIAWCGAGLSVPAGLPTWDGLRARLQQALEAKANSFVGADRVAATASAAKIKGIYNHWTAFQLLKRELGKTTFDSVVREAFQPANTSPVPEAYSSLWRLRIAGLLTLNLDRLATRAFSELHAGQNVAQFDSRAVGGYTHVLKSPEPFIYNVHGVVGDQSTWVFTQDDLRQLMESDAYRNFISGVFATSTVLFAGVSADDVAAGGHLDRLVGQGIDTGSHFWITDRRDRKTDDWAEAAGIRVIRYESMNGDHTQLREMFTDLMSYVPKEDSAAPPVVLSVDLPAVALPEPDELMRDDAEAIRLILNRNAMEILADETVESYKRYEEFSVQYDEPIHRAWYTSTKPGRNILLGFRLEEEAAQGAFGKVFRAISPDGRLVAVKVLLNEIRSEPAMLQSFRRGVRSMRILSERNVAGMVPYREASEIPALVVMDWIEGANLKHAVEAKQLDDWPSILKVGVELSNIIRIAHALPERVLHRDLRPANIMLEGLWSGNEWQVVVLDFDLSWHRGAFEASVVQASGTLGYLAPEQIQTKKGISSRHGAVDSFGVGMSLYYVVSGRDPVPAQNVHADWAERVLMAATARECRPWRSLPARFGRVILNATREIQSERWDMTQIWGELLRLTEAYEHPNHVQSVDLVAEEIAARTDVLSGYRWDVNANAAVYESPSGLSTELIGVESSHTVRLKIAWASTGVEERKRIAKWVEPAASSAAAILTAAGWRVDSHSHGSATVQVIAELPLEDARSNLDKVALSINKAAGVLRFV